MAVLPSQFHMDRPVRRSRQKAPPSELIGLLPQEEAAINRALHKSLLQKKKKYTRHKPSLVSGTRTPSQPHPAPSTYAASTSAPSKRVISHVQTEQESYSDAPIDGPSSSSSSTVPLKRRRLRSPLSPSHSLEYLSSESKPSSPVRGNVGTLFGRTTSSSSLSSPRSVESSLKLVLSPTPWSRSSSSSWTPTPEPDMGTGPNKPTTLGKGASAPTKKKTPGKYNKSTPKAKVSEEVSTTEAQPPKRKRGRPRKYPPKETTTKTPPKAGRGGRGRGRWRSTGLGKSGGKTPKTYTKASLQYHGAKMIQSKTGKPGRGGGQSGGRGLLRLTSPEAAALVLHDHCYNMERIGQMETVGEVEDDVATDAQSLIRSSPYAAQRKFAQNQAPNSTPTKLTRDEVEGVSPMTEIPKTEDFIHFLCLRGSDSIPKELEKFSFPWTQLQQRKSKGNNGKVKSRNVAKKLGDSIATSSPVSATH